MLLTRPPAVIPEIDIWRAAQLMIRQYGQHAGDQADARAERVDDGIDAGRSSPVARQTHNLKVVGSNPTPPATN